MTLKITRFLTDAFNKQAKISHFSNKIQVGKPTSIKSSYIKMIKAQFGDLFLNDANYIIMTKLGANDTGFDKFKKKFVEVIAAVLNTAIAKSEVKSLQLHSTQVEPSIDADIDADNEDIENSEFETSSNSSDDVILLVKVTTK